MLTGRMRLQVLVPGSDIFLGLVQHDCITKIGWSQIRQWTIFEPNTTFAFKSCVFPIATTGFGWLDILRCGNMEIPRFTVGGLPSPTIEQFPQTIKQDDGNSSFLMGKSSITACQWVISHCQLEDLAFLGCPRIRGSCPRLGIWKEDVRTMMAWGKYDFQQVLAAFKPGCQVRPVREASTLSRGLRVSILFGDRRIPRINK